MNLPALDGSDRCTDTYRNLIKNVWNCLSCGALFGTKQVECPLCKTFRPMETYDNLLHRPDKVTQDEIEALKLRRKIEKQSILDLEISGTEQKKDDAAASKKDNGRDLWYMISSDWL